MKILGGQGGGGGREVELGGQGGCDQRIEVFGKIHTKKKFVGGGGGGVRVRGVRVDVYEELKFLCKFKKKMGGGGSVRGGRVGGIRVDVNEELKFL